MKKHELIDDEPTILKLWPDVPPDPPASAAKEPEGEQDDEPQIESIWMGRSLGMRRSARWAA